MKSNTRIDKGCYKAGCYMIAASIIYIIISKITGFHIADYQIPCIFHMWTGYYCPGCGGTRAVIALSSGEFLKSFLLHPVVPYTAIVGGWFMLSQSIQRLSQNRIRIGLHYRDVYLWIALALVLLNFLIKNIAIFFWKLDLLA